ncbi:MAG: alpha-galactosidase [Planctomycetia bacterium]|nr:alpha-galactosidase [Planctomycetia bacterium]
MIESLVTSLCLTLGFWTVQFNPSNSELTLRHDSGVAIVGVCALEVGDQVWRLDSSRDGVDARLAFIDANNNAQGYLTFNDQGDRLEMHAYHRTRQFYNGRVLFTGRVYTPRGSFACRTNPDTSETILTLTSGPADSLLFDSIFMPETDVAVRFEASSLQLDTRERADDSTQTDLYNLTASGRIEKSAEATFVVTCDRDYFKKRWVPYYAPIDRTRCPKAPTGWMSWNVYFDKATAQDNLAEARIAQEFLQPFGLEIWSIESWQGNSDQLPVSKFYNMNLETNEEQFPLGMKRLADDIRALGFRPGLWTAPFGTGSEEFYQAHKDWFLHNAEGQPISSWNGKYTLDPTNDEAIAHLRHIHDVAAHQWGYEFFKIDGMSGSGPGYSAHLFERPEVVAQFKNPNQHAPFERCVQALREGIGDDRIFLACQGHFSGPEAAYADAARTGADIVSANQPVKWSNVLNQAGRTLNQVFVNNIVFYTDPDTLLVRDLPLEEARVSATIVALPGQLTFFGDKLANLPSEKTTILQQTLPVCDVKPGALYPYFDQLAVWDLKVARKFGAWDVVALFNWTEEEATLAANFAELGLKPGAYVGYEFWTQTPLGVEKERFQINVPPHAVRLLAISPAIDRPQFLSSDRHLTQGAVDLQDCSWNDNDLTLNVKIALVANHTTVAKFNLPANFQLEGVQADAVDVSSELDGATLAVALRAQESGVYQCALKFEKK